MDVFTGVKLALDAMLDGALLISPSYRIEYANKALEAEFGPSWRTRKCHEYFHGSETPCKWCQNCRVFAGESVRWDWPCPITGKTYIVHDAPLCLPGRETLKFEYLHDISAQKSAERGLQKAKNFYAALSQAIKASLDARTEGALFNEVCRILVESCHLEGAWIGLLEDDGHVRADASFGMEQSYLDAMDISLEGGSSSAEGPTAMAIRSGKTQIHNDFLGSGNKQSWHEMARSAGFASAIATPIRRKGKACGVIKIYSGERNFFDTELVKVAEELASSVSIAIDLLAQEEEKARADFALSSSEERYRRISEDMPALVVRCLPDTLLLYANKATQDFFGYSAETLLRHRFTDFMPPDKGDKLAEKIASITPKSPSFVNESILYRHDGAARCIRWITRGFFDAGGKLSELQGTGEDITEMKEADQRLGEAYAFTKEIISSAAEGVVVFNRELRPLVWNRAMVKLTGISASEALSSKTGELFPLLTGNETLELASRALTGEILKSEDMPFDFPRSGRKGWAACSFAPHRNSSGSIVGLIATVSDNTTRKEAEESLVEARRKAEDAARAKSEFLACMSHEIRTPLNAILGMSELLSENRGLSPEESEFCHIILDSGFKLMETINDILEYSRLDAGSIKLESSQFNLKEELEGVARLMASLAEKKGIAFVFETAGELPELLEGDPLHIRQVVINLAGNAIKFTEKGFVKLFVKASSCENGGILAEIAVSDSGVGIAEEALHSIFLPFTQEDSSSSRHFDGTGLGLAISKKIAGLLGGGLTVDSVKGTGSTFTLSAPLKIAPALKSKPESPQAPPLFKAKALVVEDNASNSLLLKKILARMGVETQIAETGMRALELFTEERFDIVFMDLRMPGMDGFETCKAIRALEASDSSAKRVPIVAVTAEVMSGEEERCYETGMDGFIPKPIKARQIADALTKHLGAKRLRAAQPS